MLLLLLLLTTTAADAASTSTTTAAAADDAAAAAITKVTGPKNRRPAPCATIRHLLAFCYPLLHTTQQRSCYCGIQPHTTQPAHCARRKGETLDRAADSPIANMLLLQLAARSASNTVLTIPDKEDLPPIQNLPTFKSTFYSHVFCFRHPHFFRLHHHHHHRRHQRAAIL